MDKEIGRFKKSLGLTRTAQEVDQALRYRATKLRAIGK